MAPTDLVLDHIIALLRRAGCFPPAELDDIQSIAEGAAWFSIPGGSTLFKQAEPSDSLYVLLSGVLGTYVADDAGGERLLNRVGPGEFVGEMGCLTGETRSATVRALRSCELLGISRQHLERLASRSPGILMSLCRTAIGRLRNAMDGRAGRYRPRTFCVLPYDEGVDARTVAEQLTAALDPGGAAFLVSHDACLDYTASKLFALEAEHEHVVYLAETTEPAWSRLCLHQADTILVVVRGSGDAKLSASFRQDVQSGIAIELVLLWDQQIEPSRTQPWLRLVRPRRHFHVRSAADIGRLARLLTGKGLGLVADLDPRVVGDSGCIPSRVGAEPGAHRWRNPEQPADRYHPRHGSRICRGRRHRLEHVRRMRRSGRHSIRSRRTEHPGPPHAREHDQQRRPRDDASPAMRRVADAATS